jgi:ATP-dependent Clp protease adaptor protein ClpS
MTIATLLPGWDEQEVALLEDEVKEPRQLVVFNDDVNTFDHVIETLIKICRHTPEQAEQCTLLIHYKGQCTVKEGEFPDLAPMCTAIHGRGISADII